MANNAYREQCHDVIGAVIEVAKRVASEDIVRSGLRHVVRLNNAPEGKINYDFGIHTIHNLTNLFHYIDAASSQRSRNLAHMVIMLKMFSYVQCLENRYTYKALGNLLRIIQNQPPDGELCDSFTSGTQCFAAIAKLAQGVSEGDGLLEVWKQFVDFKLRNAISHGDFVIRKEPGVVFVPSVMLSDIAGHDKKPALKGRYSFQEVDELYRKANDFQAVFKEHLQQQFDIAIGPRY